MAGGTWKEVRSSSSWTEGSTSTPSSERGTGGPGGCSGASVVLANHTLCAAILHKCCKLNCLKGECKTTVAEKSETIDQWDMMKPHFHNEMHIGSEKKDVIGQLPS